MERGLGRLILTLMDQGMRHPALQKTHQKLWSFSSDQMDGQVGLGVYRPSSKEIWKPSYKTSKRTKVYKSLDS